MKIAEAKREKILLFIVYELAFFILLSSFSAIQARCLIVLEENGGWYAKMLMALPFLFVFIIITIFFVLPKFKEYFGRFWIRVSLSIFVLIFFIFIIKHKLFADIDYIEIDVDSFDIVSYNLRNIEKDTKIKLFLINVNENTKLYFKNSPSNRKVLIKSLKSYKLRFLSKKIGGGL